MRTGALRAILFLFLLATAAAHGGTAYEIQITLKPRGLVWGDLSIPVSAGPSVRRVELLVNGVKFSDASFPASQAGRGHSAVFHLPVGKYIRRLRVRVVGYDANGRLVGADEMAVNDPQPPFRVRIQAPPEYPEDGPVEVTAMVTAPPNVPVSEVELWAGETLLTRDTRPPYGFAWHSSLFPDVRYLRAVAHGPGGLEANDVHFWSDVPHESVEVVVKHIPLSVAGDNGVALTKDDLTLIDDGLPREIEALLPADDQPLNVIMLIDSSESMLDELPIVQRAAREFARTVIRENDRIAVVAFHQRIFWLTGFTSNHDLVDAAIAKLEPQGQTHLYDAVISMLYELQKMPGRKALVVLSDGVNSGGTFELDHLVHYARYAGVPIYPVVKNKWLSRLMRFRLALTEARRFAEIARESGATYFVVESPSELPEVYRAIADELRRQYLLVFRTESTGTDAWHSIAVRTRKDVDIRVPRGYFP
ncbi:MAG: VWA domain-containing protein [Thermoanaerobaculia bacterium]